MTRTNKKYDVLYHGTDSQGAEYIKLKGFPSSELNEHDGPCHVVFLTDDIRKARKWGEVLIEVQLEGIETHYFFNGDYWYFYVLADEINAQSSWRVIDVTRQKSLPYDDANIDR